MEGLPSVTSPPWSLRTRRTVALILLFVIGIFMWRLGDMWPPVIVSLVLAYLLSPLVGRLQRRIPFGSVNTRRTMSTIATFLLALMAVVLVIGIIVPAIITQMRQFGDALPTLYAQIEDDLEDALSVPMRIGSQTFVPLDVLRSIEGVNPDEPFNMGQFDLVAALQDLFVPLTSPVLGALGSALSGVLSAIFVLTMVFYLMKDGPLFITQIETLFAESYRDDVRYLIGRLGDIWNAYLRGQLVLSLTMGVVVFLVALVLGVRSPLVLGLLSGILEFIPNIGPALALIPAAVFALFFPSATIPGLEGPFFMIVVVVVWTGLQNLEAIFLVPRIMGDNLDLHPFVVIMAVIGGASLAGALGVILAAPVVATLRLLGDYFYVKIVRPDLTRLPAGALPLPPPADDGKVPHNVHQEEPR